MILKNEIEREKQDLALVATEENGPHRHNGERTWDLMLVQYDNLTICVSVYGDRRRLWAKGKSDLLWARETKQTQNLFYFEQNPSPFFFSLSRFQLCVQKQKMTMRRGTTNSKLKSFFFSQFKFQRVFNATSTIKIINQNSFQNSTCQ